MSFITVKDLEVIFTEKPSGPLMVLENFCLNIEEGEFLSIIGPSGCGKSTLLKWIARLYKGGGKGVEIYDKLCQLPKLEPGELGFVFQSSVLFPWRSVKKNINLPKEVIPGQKVFKELKELLEEMELHGFEESLPNELSGGMKARAHLAAALSHCPKVILMDEPFASLDTITRKNMGKLVLDWKDKNKNKTTVILVTHDIREAVSLANRIIVTTSRPSTVRRDIKLPAEKNAEEIKRWELHLGKCLECPKGRCPNEPTAECKE